MKIPHKEKLLDVVESFSLTEKIFFYFFVAIFAGSALFLLIKMNGVFMSDIPARGGEIREGVIGYPRFINPILNVTDSGRDLSILIYSGLLKARPGGLLENDLAKDYKISEDGLTYTFTLKDNIYFHDNTRVTAQDIEFTIKKVLDPALKSPKAPNFEGVSVNVLNDTQIEFTLKHPYAPFLENLTLGILPKHIWKDIDPDAFALSQYNFEPIGAGPYMIEDIKRDKAGLPLYYHLKPFSDYALGRAYISDLYIYFFTNEKNLVEAFENGVIRSANGISPKNIEIMKNTGIVLQVPLPRIFGLFFNQNENAVFANKEVRLALNEAVDRENIIKEVLEGYGTKSLSLLPSYLSNKKDSDLSAEERIISAEGILKKAGWTKNEQGLMTKSVKKETTELAFSISTSNAPELKKTAEILKSTWEKMGAKVDIKVFDLAELQQNVIRPRKYDSLLFGEVIGRDLDLFAFWHSSERNDPGLNMAMYTNSKVDKLLEEARRQEEDDKKKTLLLIEELIIADAPAVFLYSPDFIYVVPENIKGISLDEITSSSERFLNVEKWFIETDKVWNIFKK